MSFKTRLKRVDIRQSFSTKLLDIAETIPVNMLKNIKPMHQCILLLQKLRKEQRNRAKEDLQKRQKPQNTDIELSKIILIVTFEYEEFKYIKKIINSFKPLDNRSTQHLKSIVEDSFKVGINRTLRFGVIEEKERQKNYQKFINVKQLNNLPKNVDSISLTYYRPLSSVASLIFEFNLSDKVSETLSNIQTKEHLENIRFKFPFSYEKNFNNFAAKYAINKHKNNVRFDLEKWIKERFKLNKQEIKQISFVDLYKIYGNPRTEIELQKWKKDNDNWLNDYAILSNSNCYYSNEKIYTIHLGYGAYDSVHIVSKLEPHIKKEGNIYEDTTGDDILAIATIQILFSILNKYGMEINTLNAKGLNVLSSWNQILYALDIIKIKKLKASVLRYKNEIEEIKNKIYSLISELKIEKQISIEKEIDLGQEIVGYLEFKIKEIEKSIQMLDSGLTEIVSIYNTKAMLLLTTIVTIATIVGVCISYFGSK